MFEQVLLARHGETEWNHQGRKQGRLDSPLTTRGLGQAARNAEAVRDRRVDGVFSSPLGRARSTAEVLAAALDLPVVVLDELTEMDHEPARLWSTRFGGFPDSR